MEVDDQPRLTLRRAIDIALEANLALAVNRFDVELARDDLDVARSQRRPQLEVGAQALVIDASFAFLASQAESIDSPRYSSAWYTAVLNRSRISVLYGRTFDMKTATSRSSGSIQ